VRAALLGVLVAAVACERAPADDFTPVLVVHGLISVQACNEFRFNRELQVSRTFATGEEPESLPGADVRVWRGTDGWSYAWVDGWLYFRPDPPPLRSLDTVRLRVAKDGFDTLYGSTVLPDTFGIIRPARGDTVRASDTMAWTRARGAHGYYMPFRTTFQGQTFYFSLLIPNDSVPGLPYDSLVVRLPMVFASGYSRFADEWYTVIAVDSNYYEWLRGDVSAAGVLGGRGVLGAATFDSVSVTVAPESAYLRFPPEPPPGAVLLEGWPIRPGG
jgi:hypothetical protein